MAQGDGPFFSAVLSRVMDPLVRDRLREELAGLCNKAMVAESIDLFDIGDMEWVVKKVFHYLNLGLQRLSGEEEGKAAQILRTVSLQKVFQSESAHASHEEKAEALLKDRGLIAIARTSFPGFIDKEIVERFEKEAGSIITRLSTTQESPGYQEVERMDGSVVVRP
jgi:hypothetical protein